MKMSSKERVRNRVSVSSGSFSKFAPSVEVTQLNSPFKFSANTEKEEKVVVGDGREAKPRS